MVRTMNRRATWKRIGLVFSVATVCASSSVLADEGDLLRQRGRRLQPPSGQQQAVVKEAPNPGGEIIIIPDPRPKRRPGRSGPVQESPSSIESTHGPDRTGWLARFLFRFDH